jgi:hypothetical protein
MHSARLGEIWFRRILIFVALIAAIALACNFAMLLWAQNEFSAPESVVGTQAMMLARSGTLYTICAYMPLYYFLEATLSKVGFDTVIAGRLVSFAALLGIVAVVCRLLILYTRDRWSAYTGACSPPPPP